MPFCNAFDRFNSPCLSEVPHGCDVCEQHTYFYGPQWLERFPFAPEPNARMFFFSSPSKIKAIYVKAIVEGRVKITRDDIKRLEDYGPSESCIDYYTICCMQDGVDPLSSPKLFTQVVKQIVNFHRPMVYDAIRADPQLLTRFLNPLLDTSYRSFGNMVCHILYCAYRLKTSNDLVQNIDATVSLIQEIKNHPKFSSEFLWEHSDTEEKLINMLLYSNAEPGSIQEKIKKFFMEMKGLRQEAQIKQRKLFSDKREEIVALAWSPERFRQWCLDTEEVTRFLEYSKWPIVEDPATKENQRKPL